MLGREGSTLLRHLTFAVLGVAAVMALTYVLPPFRNYQLSLVLMYLIATAGLTVLIGLNGQLSLGHGAIMAVGGYTTAFVQKALVRPGLRGAARAGLGTVGLAHGGRVDHPGFDLGRRGRGDSGRAADRRRGGPAPRAVPRRCHARGRR